MPKRKYDYGIKTDSNGKHKYKNREDYFASCSVRAREAKEQSIEQLKTTCIEIGKEFNAILEAPLDDVQKPRTWKAYGQQLDERIVADLDLDNDMLKYMPYHSQPQDERNAKYKAIKEEDTETQKNKSQHPICVDDPLKLIQCAIETLKKGLQFKQYPVVQLAFCYLVPFRKNDVTLKPRANKDVPKTATEDDPGSFYFVNDTDKKIVGTIMNKMPSKKCSNKGYIEQYSVVCLCSPEHHALIQEALEFLQNAENYNESQVPTKYFLEHDKECGYHDGADWKLISEWHGLNKCVDNWGFLEDNQRLLPSYGRAFGACVLSHLFKRDEKLQNEDVMTEELGHINNSADGHYHTFNVCCKKNIEKIPGVTLHRASSLGLCEHGLALVQDDEENETS